MKKIAVLMGSASDKPTLEPTIHLLKTWEIPLEVHVLSAHRTPEETADFARNAAANGFGVIIAAAGKAAHLAGAVAAQTVLPVIGLPVKASTEVDNFAALLATVQMPTGIPVATVAVGGAENAALLAVQILAVEDETIRAKLIDHRAEMKEKVLAANRKIAI